MHDIDPALTWRPVVTLGEERHSRWLIVCDHATNRVPPHIADGDLGLAPADMARHIAWDPGAAGVSIRLAERLGAPCVLSNFSRLVIDPNRGLDDPTLVMRLYDGTIIPANRGVTPTEIEERIATCYRPYDDEVARIAGRRADTVIVAMHSFTPQLRGKAPRPWHVGLLFADDDRLSRPLGRRLSDIDGVCVGLNEPYSGALHGDTMDRHAIRQGRQNALIEIRNDLISDAEGETLWADRLAATLPGALEDADQGALVHG